MSDINSKDYWDIRFKTRDWEQKGGDNQSRFFYNLAIKSIPNWLEKEIMKEGYTICDIGCATGDGTKLLYDQFFNSDIYGLDFSPEAINIATEKYKDITFKVGDICNIQENYDVIFSSNTLEHFRKPWDTVKSAINKSKKYTVLLLPLNEINRIDEHFSTFQIDTVPMKIENATLVYYDIIDCREIEHTYWSGEQIFLVYLNQEKENKYSYTLNNFIDNTYNKIQEVKVLDLKESIKRYKEENQKLEETVSILEKEARKLEIEIENGNNQIENLNKEMLSYKEAINNFKKDYKILEENSQNKLIEEQKKHEDYKHELEIQIKETQDAYEEGKQKIQELRCRIQEKISIEKNKSIKIQKEMQELAEFYTAKEREYKNYLADRDHLIKEISLEKDKFSSELWQIYNSTFWKVALKYYYFRDHIPGVKQLYRIMKKVKQRNNVIHTEDVSSNISESMIQTAQLSQIIEMKDKIVTFLESINRDKPEHVLLVYSGVKFVESEGQRVIRLINEALLKDIKVIFCYWRWDNSEPIDHSSNKDMLNIPIDLFLECKNMILDYEYQSFIKKVFLVEFPHPTAFEVISLANCKGWTSIYDIIDEWKEFNKVGEAVWYNEEIEKYLINNSTFVTATAYKLGEKAKNYGAEEVTIVKNAVNPRGLKLEKENNEIGKENLNIGYFGHLTESWFDWEMVIRIAKNNPKWIMHIIGYGEPHNLKVPKNVILYGKIEHVELPKYTKKWDIAIIPFKNTKLTESVDPIKVYEYLHLRLPVVAANMPDLKDYPYTKVVNNEQDFEKAIVELSNVEVDYNIMSKFVANNTWQRRLEQLLELTKDKLEF